MSLPFLAWLTGALFFLHVWILRVAPSVMVEDLMRDFGIGAAAVGNLSAFYFYSYSAMQIPVGLLVDRFGPRRPMALAAAACGAGCVLFALGGGLWGLFSGRLLIGAAAAFSLVGTMAVAGRWFPPRRFALLSGFAMLMGMVGAVFGQAPLSLLIDAQGWRTATLLLALAAFALAAAAWGTVRDGERPAGNRQVLAGLGAVLANRQTWLVAVAGLGTTGPLLGFAGLWGVPYLAVSHGLDREAAAAVTSAVFVGFGAGAPLLGWLSDRIGRRRPLLVAGLLLCASGMAAIAFVPGLPVSALGALCFLCGLGGAAQIVGFAMARELNPARASGTAVGAVNGLVTAGGALYQPLLGWLLDLGWTGRLAAGARVYDLEAYRLAFAALVIGACLGLLGALATRETHCRQIG